MSGVTDRDDAAAVPLLLIHPLDGRAVDLFVAVQGGEKLLNRLGKPVKATPQSREPATYIIAKMRLGNMAKSMSVAAAHRTETDPRRSGRRTVAARAEICRVRADYLCRTLLS